MTSILKPDRDGRVCESRAKLARSLTTGLGDRFMVMLGLAAFGRYYALNVVVPWENSQPERTYALDVIKQYAHLPENLEILPIDSTRDLVIPELLQNGGELPAHEAYDCIPHLIPKTFDHFRPAIPPFVACYRAVCRELTFAVGPLPEPPYVALHLRGGDKGSGRYSQAGSFNTQEVIEQVEQYFPILVTTDDLVLLEQFCIHRRIKAPDLPREVEGDEMTVAALHDLNLLSNAAGIIQHSPDGWSAYSNLASIMRDIPLISTWVYDEGECFHRINDLVARGATLPYWYDYKNVESFLNALA